MPLQTMIFYQPYKTPKGEAQIRLKYADSWCQPVRMEVENASMFVSVEAARALRDTLNKLFSAIDGWK